MDEDGEKRVRAKGSGNEIGEVDRLTNLPESLLCHVLLNLPTKDVVKTSVLSSKWRHIWRYVPGLDLTSCDFTACSAVVSFIDRFLSFNSSESCLNKFKLWYAFDGDKETNIALVTRWINTVIKRKVQHLYVACGEVEIPPTIYMCESLVSLELTALVLPKPECVSLPSVKVIVLDTVKFANELAFEMLISGCLALESLTLHRSHNDNVNVLRVSSQSLLRFSYNGYNNEGPEEDDPVVAIDAPKLQDLKLSHHVDIDINFNFGFGEKFDPKDLPKRNMIRNFLVGISGVKHMIIAPCTLEVICGYSRCEPLPLFPNLSFLSVDFYNNRWDMLPIFLESCPKLKSLVVISRIPKERTSILCGPRHLLSSLEYVEIKWPLDGWDAMGMELVSYLLEKSPILKKLTLCFDNISREEDKYVIRRELRKIPRRSSSCQVVAL